MLELIEVRIKELKQAIQQSEANHNGLVGRLLEAEWMQAQCIKSKETEPKECESCD